MIYILEWGLSNQHEKPDFLDISKYNLQNSNRSLQGALHKFFWQLFLSVLIVTYLRQQRSGQWSVLFNVRKNMYSWMNTRQIDIFFKFSNSWQCWFMRFVRFVTMKLFLFWINYWVRHQSNALVLSSTILITV